MLKKIPFSPIFLGSKKNQSRDHLLAKIFLGITAGLSLISLILFFGCKGSKAQMALSGPPSTSQPGLNCPRSGGRGIGFGRGSGAGWRWAQASTSASQPATKPSPPPPGQSPADCSCGQGGGQCVDLSKGPIDMKNVGWIWLENLEVVDAKGNPQKTKYNRVPFHHLGLPQLVNRWRWSCDNCHVKKEGGGPLKTLKVQDPYSMTGNPLHKFCSNCHNQEHANLRCADLKNNKNAPIDMSKDCNKCHFKKDLPKGLPGHFKVHLNIP